ncbi:MAG TPA: tRNA uridine-5-carboxymethylaminomethyl(34) synthesis GTPase MnmE, partial [Saprospiraceae bacterium]|nr:tRNA uridine-5-carboxymethylaminomethyl(34) synthesis GTPase MnmE [Saprospiraceae bacterium]
DPSSGAIIDEVVVGLFKGPRSYTSEDVIEISCHGSSYILTKVIELLTRAGARMATRGEFTLRAFLNGKMDLSQAEAVADLIASENKGSHELAMKQMRGGFTDQISALRQELIDFAALIELELDFSEEDVIFADRNKLATLVKNIQSVIHRLLDSFQLGNAIKKGVPIAIIGKPNVGKSTLLNALLNEERAIVSDIPGTTRDVIEDALVIDGIQFRVIDTAGIRKTSDTIESIGITKTMEQIDKAQIVLYVHDIRDDHHDISTQVKALTLTENQHLIVMLNKADLIENMCSAYDIEEAVSTLSGRIHVIAFSAKNKTSLDRLTKLLVEKVTSGMNPDETIITNARHYEALDHAYQSLDDVLTGLNTGVTGDFIAMDIRRSLHHLGSITGEIHTDELLGSIFGRFCIGK